MKELPIELSNSIESALRKEKDELIVPAIQILKQCLATYPQYYYYILEHIADIYYKNNYEPAQSFDWLLKCYTNTNDEYFLPKILQRYYEPKEEQYNNNLTKNIKLLEKYQFCDLDNIETITTPNHIPKILWADNTQIVYLQNNNIDIIKLNQDFHTNQLNAVNKNGYVLMQDIIGINSILKIEAKNNNGLKLLSYKQPFYLYYTETMFGIFLQMVDLEALLRKERFVFIIGRKQLKAILNDDQTILPNYPINVNMNIWDIVKEKHQERTTNIPNYIVQLTNYYKENETLIAENVKKGTPKVLFVTSRFTTALQYHTRDCKEACEDVGCETRLVIEKSDISNIGYDYIKTIAEFKPDIIFCIDHFRFEYSFIPPQPFFVTYIQDPMPHVVDKNTPGKLVDRDFILNFYPSMENIFGVEYPKNKIIDAPACANHKIYKPYELSPEEIEQYSCDICIVTHVSNVQNQINEILRGVQDVNDRNEYESIFLKYYNHVYNTGEFIYDKEQCKEYIIKNLPNKQRIINAELLNYLSEQMKIFLNNATQKNLIARWLIEAGFTNIKLWGQQWLEQDIFKPFAYGPAKNGETLSKIFQASKIVIGMNPIMTLPSRAVETLISGGFYLANHLPPEYDSSRINLFYEEGSEFVFHHYKDDLIKKVTYYLEHEEERKKIAFNGMKKALQRSSYSELMRKMIKEISDRMM